MLYFTQKQKSKRQNHKRQKLQKFIRESKEQGLKTKQQSYKLSDISHYLIELINCKYQMKLKLQKIGINCITQKLLKLCKIDELSQISCFYFSIINLAYLKFVCVPTEIKKSILHGVKLVILNSDYFNEAFYTAYINLFKRSQAHQLNQEVINLLQQGKLLYFILVLSFIVGSLISTILRGKTTKSTLFFSQQLMNSTTEISGQNFIAVENLANAFIISNHNQILKIFPDIAQQIQTIEPPNIHYRRPSQINDTSHLKQKSLQLDSFQERRSINYSPYSRNESANSKKRVAFTFQNLKSPFSNVSDKNFVSLIQDTKDAQYQEEYNNDIPLFERVPSKQQKINDEDDAKSHATKIELKIDTEEKQLAVISDEDFNVPAIF